MNSNNIISRINTVNSNTEEFIQMQEGNDLINDQWKSNEDNLPELQTLSLSGCHSLTEIPALANLPALQEIHLSGCHSLGNVDNLRGAKNHILCSSDHLPLSWII